MPTDKKISELQIASAINATDLSILVSSGTDYQFAFSTLLQFISSGLNVGAGVSFGTTLPQNTTGKDGDVFINTSAGTFAQKIAGVWTVVYALPSSGASSDGTVLYGLGIPSPTLGANNDTCINTGTGIFYKKSAGIWGQVFSMQTGPASPAGTSGTNGTNGADGKTILNGTTDPSNLSTGIDGDFYINTGTFMFFGPKAGGIWPAGTSLAGTDGATGATGHGVLVGGTSGQVLAKNSGADYDTAWQDIPEPDFSLVESEIGDTSDLRTLARTTVDAINEILSKVVVLPNIGNLVEDFDSERGDLITISSGKISQILGAKSSTASSQTDSTKRPAYMASGGANDLPYLSFSNAYLTGTLIITGTEFTYFVIRKVHSASSVTGPIYNGGISDGFGISDGNTYHGKNMPGMYFQGATEVESYGFVQQLDTWEAFAGSHSTGVNKFYNSVGFSCVTTPNSTNPNTPTGQHYIGYVPGQSYYTGGIQRILIYDRQLTDLEINSVLTYLSQHYRIPRPKAMHWIGDSISAGLGVTNSYPEQLLYLMASDNKQVFLNDAAASGRQSSDCLAGLPTEVISKKVSSVTNMLGIMVGHNDLAANVDITTIYSNLTSIISDAHSAGIKVLLCSVLKSTNETGNPTAMARFNSLNSLILANTAGADLISDVNTLSELSDPTDTTVFQDGTHPTQLGDSYLAAFLKPFVESLI